MSKGLHDWGSKDEQGRRNAQKKGVHNNQFQCQEQAARFARRAREDETFARELGVRMSYDDIRTQGARVWR